MNNWLKGSPWSSEAELTADLKNAWEDMKQTGLDKGILTQRADGAIVGKGNPNIWFDAVEKEHGQSRNLRRNR